MSFTDFLVFPPRHGRSVTDFWGWDAHEARLRYPGGVSGDIGGCSARRALKPNFYSPTQTMVTAGILPFRENSQRRTGNRTRDLMISSQRLWPLDHEAGLSSCWMPFLPWQSWIEFHTHTPHTHTHTHIIICYHATHTVEAFHILKLCLIYNERYWGWLPWHSHYLSFFHIHFHPTISSNFNQ